MVKDEKNQEIAEIEKEIARLPEGNITKKKINDKDYYYHRIIHNGKRTEKYVSFDKLPDLFDQIEKRKELERELKDLKKSQKESHIPSNKTTFKTIVRTGEVLKDQVSFVKNYKQRECIQSLKDYIYGEIQDKVFILYGLRRTGKTTMIRQVIAEMQPSVFNKAAFIQVKAKDTLSDVNHDLLLLEKNGYQYIFIDEVTLLEDFIENASIFSDIYASSGMKIILSGTDSLGFAFSKQEQLYDRCILLHTTFIPYREFENVLGIKGIDEYIRYGGTMSLSGKNYNSDTIFSNTKNTEEYIDTAIAKNIQHSLKMYEYGGHFRKLLDLYEKNELTNVINRVIEHINHRFTRDVIESTFKSHGLSITANNLLKDRSNPIDIKEHINLDKVTNGIMEILDILNKEEQSIEIEDAHLQQIKEYLVILDLIQEIDLEFLPDVEQKSKITVITQPGLRYAQASAIIDSLLLDSKFLELSPVERKRITERLLDEIRGRMMEEIVLLETALAKHDKKIFKLQFPIGEFDMVIYDQQNLSCEIYEIKHSKEKVANQYRHLIDQDKCAMVEHRYGEITKKIVIYRGKTCIFNDIEYLNVEEYLKSLTQQKA